MKKLTAAALLCFWSFTASADDRVTVPSPAEKQLALARRAIQANPKTYASRNALSLALTRRARETSNAEYYTQALEALEQSFRLQPDNFAGRRIEVWTLLGRHEFARALEKAEILNRRAPDDILTYALLTDAYVELGKYDQAERAVQWMLDLRPGNVAALTRGAYLRELFGDVEGAAEWMTEAYQRTRLDEIEDRAWLLTQVAHLQLGAGRMDEAEASLNRALELFPDYHYALANLANVRTAQGEHAEAAELLRRHCELAPHPENFFYLGQALLRAGRVEEAQAVFAKFEAGARREMDNNDNANRELVFYYLENSRRPTEALAIARAEIERRRDVFTLDALAWALHANGQLVAAQEAIEHALQPGIQDARLLYHAGVIALDRNDEDEARRYLNRSLAVNPASSVAESARQALGSFSSNNPPAAIPSAE